jgi:hypothetical protein
MEAGSDSRQWHLSLHCTFSSWAVLHISSFNWLLGRMLVVFCRSSRACWSSMLSRVSLLSFEANSICSRKLHSLCCSFVISPSPYLIQETTVPTSRVTLGFKRFRKYWKMFTNLPDTVYIQLMLATSVLLYIKYIALCLIIFITHWLLTCSTSWLESFSYICLLSLMEPFLTHYTYLKLFFRHILSLYLLNQM